GGWDYMYNVDGYASFGKDPDDWQRIVSYDQLFRNGIYESYTGRVMENFERNNGKDIITLDGYEFIKTVTEKVRSIFSIFKKMKVEPPFILFMNMYNIKGAAILADGRFTNPFLCNEVSFPSIIFQSFDKNVEQKLKGLFTILWQAAGQHNCPEIVI
ncbi:MAG TPA: hypothetical protein VK588_00470, partial [Chitinophagaceae bacterium]|nr:hypothetical protein [Chitinophagaceae bacterium]